MWFLWERGRCVHTANTTTILTFHPFPSALFLLALSIFMLPCLYKTLHWLTGQPCSVISTHQKPLYVALVLAGIKKCWIGIEHVCTFANMCTQKLGCVCAEWVYAVCVSGVLKSSDITPDFCPNQYSSVWVWVCVFVPKPLCLAACDWLSPQVS